MKSNEFTEIKEYDADLNKVRCPICHKAVHGAFDIEDDEETSDFQYDWDPCPHFLYCEVYSLGMEVTSKRFEEVKQNFQKEDIEGGEFTELFIKYNKVKGTFVLSIDTGPSISGHQIFYAFQPNLKIV